MEKISEIIKHIISKRKWEGRFGLAMLKNHWEDCVGKVLAAHTVPGFISKQTLYIDVDSPVWANQLNYMQNEIIHKINQYFSKQIVTKLFFRTKPLKK
ncbi:MAG: DUF721 domain-containing protein [Spirochaetes bacterium]|nr:DUF721 domain-containing protein [Spirochaetota bacterium]